ncbi:MAG: RDD family protein [Acidobacteriota bacterium]
MICRNHVEVSEGVRRCSRCGAGFCQDCLVTIQDRPYCATCKTEQLLDVRSGVDRSRLTYATVLRRFGAQFLDGLIQTIPSYAIFFAVAIGTGTLTAGNTQFNPLIFLAYIPFFGIPILYEGLMLSKKNGQTVGKMALNMRVVRPDGSPLTQGQAWGRAAMRMVLGCLWIVDYIPVFFTDEKTTLHDMVANTRVVDAY